MGSTISTAETKTISDEDKYIALHSYGVELLLDLFHKLKQKALKENKSVVAMSVPLNMLDGFERRMMVLGYKFTRFFELTQAEEDSIAEETKPYMMGPGGTNRESQTKCVIIRVYN